MDTLDRILSYALSLAILLLALMLRKVTRTWATPACLFAMYWFVFTMVPLLALDFVPVSAIAMIYILLACVAFALPAFFTSWEACLRRNAELAPLRKHYLDSPAVRWLFALSGLTSTAFILLDLLVQGISWTEMVFNFFESSNTYLELRYEGDVKVNPFGQWGLIFAYLCVIFGSLVHAAARGAWRRTAIILLLMTPPTLVMLVQAAKGLFFVSIALVLGGHLIHRVVHDIRPHVDFRRLAGNVKYLIVAAPLVLLSFMARGLYELDDSDAVTERLLSSLAAYAFSHLYAFSDWLMFALAEPSSMRYAVEGELALGDFTFTAFMKLMGSKHVMPMGTYDEYFAYAWIAPGNLYTIFRGLITDFGFIGSFLALIAFGAGFNAAFRSMLITARPAISVALMFLLAQFIYSSYIISVVIYNSIYLVVVLNAVLLLVNRFVSPLPGSRHRGPPHGNTSRLPPPALAR